MKNLEKLGQKYFDDLFLREQLIKKFLGEVLEASELEEIISSDESFSAFISKLKRDRQKVAISEDKVLEQCQEIYKNIQNKVPGNIAILLNRNSIVTHKEMHELENTVIKMTFRDSLQPRYMCLGVEQSIDMLFCLGGTDCNGYVITNNDEGQAFCRELLELNLLSTTKNPDDGKSYGLAVTYQWLTAKLEMDVVVGYNLKILEDFLLGEYFRGLIRGEDKNHEGKE